jgi:hypothetical protein
MLQVLDETVQCAKCGCLVLPDAARCPKCGAKYQEGKSVEANHRTAPATSRPANPDPLFHHVRVVHAHYDLDCPYHGKVRIKATVVSPSVRCPFC